MSPHPAASFGRTNYWARPMEADRTRRVLTLLVASSVVALGVLALRFGLTGSTRFGFLVWNMFLAWMPLFVALLLPRVARSTAVGGVLLGFAWLMLWPNAPYIVTDVVHLQHPGTMPWWFDAMLVALFATIALVVGLVSLHVVHRVATAHLGAAAGWIIVALSLPLGAIGVYIGRVHRFNSWDVLVDPMGIVRTLLSDPSGAYSLRAMLISISVMSVCLAAGYAVTWRALTDASPSPKVSTTE